MISLLIDKHSLYDHLKLRYLKDIALETDAIKSDV
jgi:hypothetical protein